MTTLRIGLIEDHDLTRMGLRIALQQGKNIEVVGEAVNGTEGLELLLHKQLDLALVDIGLPDIDGVEVVRQYKQLENAQNSTTKILILTMQEEEDTVLAAFAAGADSYCVKDISTGRLIEAIQSTIAGQSWIDPAIASIVLKKIRKPVRSSTLSRKVEINGVDSKEKLLIEEADLTARELEILQLIVDGYNNIAIAEKLCITMGTVKSHVRNILNKLSVDDRTQAAVLALRAGLIH